MGQVVAGLRSSCAMSAKRSHPPFNWREWIAQTGATARDPVSDDSLARAEAGLGALPSDLRDLLKVSNGLSGEFNVWLVWPVEELERQNAEFRTTEDFGQLYMPFDHLLFFGESGDGDLFAYPIKGGKIGDGINIYRWDHENDSRTWVADNLCGYIKRRVENSI